MPKTKLEIIDETVEAYSDPSNRAIDGVSGFCTFLTVDNKKCAVGRCFDKPKLTYVGSCPSIWDMSEPSESRSRKDLDTLLKEEYRGHSVKFWLDLQHFHDDLNHFSDTEITPKGREFIEGLKRKYV